MNRKDETDNNRSWLTTVPYTKRKTDGETDRQAQRKTDGYSDRNRRTDRQRETETDRQRQSRVTEGREERRRTRDPHHPSPVTDVREASYGHQSIG